MQRITNQTQWRLELVISKAAVMQQRGFWQFYRNGGEVSVGFGLDRDTGFLNDTTYTGPNEEALDALLMHLRFFVQDGDGVSFRELAQLSASDMALSAGWSEGIVQCRARLNALLDEPAQVVARELRERSLTHRDILDTFLYGHIAHAAPNNRARYQRWQEQISFPLAQFAFISVVTGILCLIFEVGQLARNELARYELEPSRCS